MSLVSSPSTLNLRSTVHVAMTRCSVGALVTASYIRRCENATVIPFWFALILIAQAYLEFFVSPDLLKFLLSHIDKDSNITYYIINRKGDLRTNTHSDGPNAVTWGVFPGKEIIQPTIVEAVSFMAWKVSKRFCSQLSPCSNFVSGWSFRIGPTMGLHLWRWIYFSKVHFGPYEHLLPGQRRSQWFPRPRSHLPTILPSWWRLPSFLEHHLQVNPSYGSPFRPLYFYDFEWFIVAFFHRVQPPLRVFYLQSSEPTTPTYLHGIAL